MSSSMLHWSQHRDISTMVYGTPSQSHSQTTGSPLCPQHQWTFLHSYLFIHRLELIVDSSAVHEDFAMLEGQLLVNGHLGIGGIPLSLTHKQQVHLSVHNINEHSCILIYLFTGWNSLWTVQQYMKTSPCLKVNSWSMDTLVLEASLPQLFLPQLLFGRVSGAVFVKLP